MSQLAFHNTNQESGATLQASQEQARRQEAVILWLFQDLWTGWSWEDIYLYGWTPSEVYHYLRGKDEPYDWPITSVRRAITNLTKQGKLEKTGLMRMGPQGKREHVWRVI